MERFELLGGKYQQGEQILPGVIQTFRAYEVPTGRPVFIHRVASKEAAGQEITGLLSAALIRSAAVRKMVVDVYESEPYRFVVTEPARQCVPLRDWLERESGHASEPVMNAPSAPVPFPTAPVAEISAAKVTPVEPAPPKRAEIEEAESDETRESPDVEATEFARMFRAALAGKMERARRDAQLDDTVMGYRPTGEPALGGDLDEEDDIDEEDDLDEPGEQDLSVERIGTPARVPPATVPPLRAPTPAVNTRPALPQASEAPVTPSPEPEMFSQLGLAEKSGRSNLVIFLVVLGVVVVALVIFVVAFVKK